MSQKEVKVYTYDEAVRNLQKYSIISKIWMLIWIVTLPTVVLIIRRY
jgi:hypothetical protein